MAASVERISWIHVVLSLALGVLAVALAWAGVYRPSPHVAFSLGSLVLVIAIGGLQPVADTLGYQCLQSATFAIWGLTVLLSEEMHVIAVVFALVGAVGAIWYGQKSLRFGVWSPVHE